MRITFQEVSVRGVRRWKENGKSRQQTRKFYQTISPFNKNADGTQKTRDQIMVEILAERKAWLELAERCAPIDPDHVRAAFGL